MFKEDDLIVGMLKGFMAVMLTFLVVLGLNYFLILLGVVDAYLPLKEMIPISLLPNLHLLRNDFLKFKKEKSARGVLLITFVLMSVFLLLHLRLHLI